MKKRFISVLLVVLMVMSLFTGLSTGASAAWNGANTIEYTMQSGDYVLRICQKLGLNYYTCKPAIMALNNIQEGQWNKLAVGRVLTLPASDQDAILLTSGAPQTTQTSGAVQTTGTATTGNTAYATTSTVNNNNAGRTADVLAYYLVPYTMSIGDTVSGVCNSLGVNFSVFQSFIKQVNDISSWNKVRAGQTLIIPTPVQPSVGTTCYGVMVHSVTNNDTAYSITSAAGVNYNANKKLLEALNQTNNLSAIKAGQKFFYPVPMTVSVPGTGNPGSTATTTTTTTVTDGNGTTTTQTTTTAKLYKLISNMSSSDGTMLFYVNNQAVTAAPAGAKVVIETNTAPGKAVQSLTVKHDSDKADLRLAGDTFIMPGCDVRVDAVIKSGHDINITSNYSGKAAASVGGITVQSAIKGAAVVIKSVDPNYEIQSISAYYKKLVSSSDRTPLNISSSNAFLMPDADVFVDIVLKPVSTYAFYVNDPVRGSFYLQVNGNPVTRAPKGAQVTVVAQANEGYEPTSLSVTKHGDPGTKVNVFSNTFTMPAFDVDVTVTFGAKGNNIVIMPSQFANVYAFKDKGDGLADAITDQETGKTVYLKLFDDDDNVISSGYTVSYDIVRNSDGLKVSCKDEGSLIYSFTMPKGGVTVTPTITSIKEGEITAEFYVNGAARTAADGYGGCSFSITWNGKISEFTVTGDKISALKQIKSKIPEGEYLDLRFDCGEGMSFARYSIVDALTGDVNEEATNEANLNGYFKMPDSDIEIEAYFETGKLAINYAAITGVGSVGYTDAAGNSINSANPGESVTVNVVPGNGYKFDDTKYTTRLIITRSDNGVPVPLTKISATTYGFTMPDVPVNVQVIFEPKPFTITMRCVDEKGNDLTGRGLWQIAVNGVPGIMDNGTTTVEVAYGDVITVAMTEAGWSNYNMISFRIDGNEYIAYVENYFYTFTMEDRWAKDLTIVATLRPSIPNNAVKHSLSADYDSTKGGVEFVILESPSLYSNDVRINSNGVLNYIHQAYTGDKVAIVVNSNDSKYAVKQGDVTVTSWFGTDADYIVPTEGWHSLKDGAPIYDKYDAVNAPYHIFYFTMPNGDATAKVNFSGTKQGVKIHVRDMSGKGIDNMIRLQVGDNFYDVAADDNFADIPFGTQVQLWRSNQAAAENKIISKADIQTAGGPVSYFDLTGYFGGIWFSMPNEAVEVYLYIDTLYYYNWTITWDQVVNGKLIFRKTDNPADPVCNLTDFSVGDTVYVWGVPNDGYDFLGIGDLNIISGTNNLATLHNPSTPNGPIWKFTLPNNGITLQATFTKKEAAQVQLTVNTNPATATVDVTVSGNTTQVTGTANITVLEGQTVTVSSATDGYSITTMSAASGMGVSGTTYTVPAGLTGATDTLNVTLAQDTYQIARNVTGNGALFITDSGLNNITSAKAGDTVTITAAPEAGYKWAAGYPKVVKSDATEVSLSGTGPWTFTMPADNVTVEAVFEADNTATVNFTAVGAADAVAKLSIPGGNADLAVGTPMTWTFVTGTKITVTGAGSYDKVRVTDDHGFDKSGASVEYTVPSGTSNVTVTLSSSAKAVTVKSMTNGTVNLRKANVTTDPTYVEGNFAVGDDIFIEVVPVKGYQLKKLEVKTNIGDTSVLGAQDTTTKYYPITGTIPDGGITISAEFEPQTVTLNFTPTVTGTADGIVANVSTGNGINPTGTTVVTASFGTTITVTPAPGYKWTGAAMTVSDSGGTVTVSGSGENGSRSFKIENPGTITVSLTLASTT